MPKADHSGIQTDLATAINAVLRPTQKGRAFTELRCTFDNHSIVPDISVLPWSDIPRIGISYDRLSLKGQNNYSALARR